MAAQGGQKGRRINRRPPSLSKIFSNHRQSQGPRLSRGLGVALEGHHVGKTSQEALNDLPLESFALQPVNGHLHTNSTLMYKKSILILFSLRSMLESKAFLLSPAEPGDVVSLKHINSNSYQPGYVPGWYATTCAHQGVKPKIWPLASSES